MNRSLKHWWMLGLFSVAGCGVFGPQAKLDRSWPVKYPFGTDLSFAPTRKGFILTKLNDTLKGYIKLVIPYEKNYKITAVPILPFNKKSKEDILQVKLVNIRYVQLHMRLRSRNTEDFMPIDSAMWQILGSKGLVTVCFRQLETFSVLNGYAFYDQMILLTGKEIIAIPMVNRGAFRSRSESLLQFINERYGKTFKKGDFGDQHDMVKYILNNETGS